MTEPHDDLWRNQAIAHLVHIWDVLMNACYNEDDPRYKNIGGRGVEMCNEWRLSLSNFVDWSLKHGYDDGMCILRYDFDSNYSPWNCFWTDKAVRPHTTRKTGLSHITLNGVTHTVAEWSRITGISRSTICNRLARGYPANEVLDPNPRPKGRKKQK